MDLNLTFKIRGRSSKINDSLKELIEGMKAEDLIGKRISIFCNGKRVGEICGTQLIQSILNSVTM